MKKKKIITCIVIIFLAMLCSINSEAGGNNNRLGLRLGTGYIVNHTKESDYQEFSQLSMGLFYQGKYFDIDIFGVTPPSGANMFSSILNVNPFRYIGFGAGYLYVYDNLAEKNKDKMDQEYHKGEHHAAVIGIVIRNIYNIRASLYSGILLNGKVSYQDTENITYRYEIKNFIDFPPSIIIASVEYIIHGNLSIMGSYHQSGGRGDIIKKPEGTSPDDNRYMDTKFIMISVGYSLSF